MMTVCHICRFAKKHEQVFNCLFCHLKAPVVGEGGDAYWPAISEEQAMQGCGEGKDNVNGEYLVIPKRPDETKEK